MTDVSRMLMHAEDLRSEIEGATRFLRISPVFSSTRIQACNKVDRATRELVDMVRTLTAAAAAAAADND